MVDWTKYKTQRVASPTAAPGVVDWSKYNAGTKQKPTLDPVTRASLAEGRFFLQHVAAPLTEALDWQRQQAAKGMFGEPDISGEKSAKLVTRDLGPLAYERAPGWVRTIERPVAQSLLDPLTVETLGAGALVKAPIMAAMRYAEPLVTGTRASRAVTEAVRPAVAVAKHVAQAVKTATTPGGRSAAALGPEKRAVVIGAKTAAQSAHMGPGGLADRLEANIKNATKGLSKDERVRVQQALHGDIPVESLTPQEHTAYTAFDDSRQYGPLLHGQEGLRYYAQLRRGALSQTPKPEGAPLRRITYEPSEKPRSTLSIHEHAVRGQIADDLGYGYLVRGMNPEYAARLHGEAAWSKMTPEAQADFISKPMTRTQANTLANQDWNEMSAHEQQALLDDTRTEMGHGRPPSPQPEPRTPPSIARPMEQQIAERIKQRAAPEGAVLPARTIRRAPLPTTLPKSLEEFGHTPGPMGFENVRTNYVPAIRLDQLSGEKLAGRVARELEASGLTREQRLESASKILGKEVTSFKDLDDADLRKIGESIEAAPAHGGPVTIDPTRFQDPYLKPRAHEFSIDPDLIDQQEEAWIDRMRSLARGVGTEALKSDLAAHGISAEEPNVAKTLEKTFTPHKSSWELWKEMGTNPDTALGNIAELAKRGVGYGRAAITSVAPLHIINEMGIGVLRHPSAIPANLLRTARLVGPTSPAHLLGAAGGAAAGFEEQPDAPASERLKNALEGAGIGFVGGKLAGAALRKIPEVDRFEYFRPGREMGAVGAYAERTPYYQGVPLALRTGGGALAGAASGYSAAGPNASPKERLISTVEGAALGMGAGAALPQWSKFMTDLVFTYDDVAKQSYAQALRRGMSDAASKQAGYRAGRQAAERMIDYANPTEVGNALRWISRFATYRSQLPGAIIGGVLENPMRAAAISRATGGIATGDQYKNPNSPVHSAYMSIADVGRALSPAGALGYGRSTLGDPWKAFLSGVQQAALPTSHPSHWATYGEPLLPSKRHGRTDLGFLAESALAGVPEARTLLQETGVGPFEQRGITPEAVFSTTGLSIGKPHSGPTPVAPGSHLSTSQNSAQTQIYAQYAPAIAAALKAGNEAEAKRLYLQEQAAIRAAGATGTH